MPHGSEDLDLKCRDPMSLVLQLPLNLKMNRQHVGYELISGWSFHEVTLRQEGKGDKTHERVTTFFKEHPNSGIDDSRPCRGHSPVA